MSMPAFALDNRHTIYALSLGVLLFGTMAYFALPIQLLIRPLAQSGRGSNVSGFLTGSQGSSVPNLITASWSCSGG